MVTVVINAVLGMAFWGLASHHYSPAKLGENAALIAAMMLLSIVAQLNLSMGIPRLLPQVRDRRWRPIVAAYSSTAVVAVVVATAFVIVAPRLSDGFAFLEGNLTLGVVLIGSVVLWNVFALQDAALTAARWAVLVPIENGVFGVLKIGIMVIVVGRFAGDGIFVAWVIAMAITLAPVNSFLFAKVLPARSRALPPELASVLPLNNKRRIAWYLATDYLAALLSQGYTALLPLLVIGVLGRAANAYFYIAFLVVSAVVALTQSLSTSLVVEGAHDEGDLADLARRTLRRYVMFIVPAIVVLVVGGNLVLHLFGPSYARNSTTVLRLLLLGTVPQSLVMLYLGVERVRANVKRVLAVEAATVVLVTAGVLAGMRGWGLNGLGVAWLISHAVVAIVVVPRLWRVSRVHPARHAHHVRSVVDDPGPSITSPTAVGGSWCTHVDVGAAILTVALLLSAGFGSPTSATTLLAVAFLTFVPGWALLDHVQLAEGTARVALAVALSWTICTVAVLVPLWLDVWEPIAVLDVLGVLSLVGVISRLALGVDRLRDDGVRAQQATGIWIAEVELSGSLLPADVSRPRQKTDTLGRVLVRLHGEFLGSITVPLNGGLTTDTITAAVLAQLTLPLRRHLDADGLDTTGCLSSRDVGTSQECPQRPTASPDELITVVVSTRERAAMLAACVGRLRRIRYPRFEVVVVDNAPITTETKDCFDRTVGYDVRFRYVVEPVRGLSRARNRGLSEANGRYVAFTDDDALVDEWWLDRIISGFARDDHAGCVTGLVPSAEIADPAQDYFDKRYSWASASGVRVYDLADRRDPSPLYPFEVGILGTGANFAVDRGMLEQLGGFDEALGAGTPAHGGEDLDVFIRVLRAGRSIVYDPSAIVWHVHRSDDEALRRQLFAYGAGLTAFLTKCIADPSTRGEVLSRVRVGVRHVRRMWKPVRSVGRTTQMLVLTEMIGMLLGPLAYFRGRRVLRRTSVVAS